MFGSEHKTENYDAIEHFTFFGGHWLSYIRWSQDGMDTPFISASQLNSINSSRSSGKRCYDPGEHKFELLARAVDNILAIVFFVILLLDLRWRLSSARGRLKLQEMSDYSLGCLNFLSTVTWTVLCNYKTKCLSDTAPPER